MCRNQRSEASFSLFPAFSSNFLEECKPFSRSELLAKGGHDQTLTLTDLEGGQLLGWLIEVTNQRAPFSPRVQHFSLSFSPITEHRPQLGQSADQSEREERVDAENIWLKLLRWRG